MTKHPSHVEQALAEFNRAEELGNGEQQRAARKRLAAALYDLPIALLDDAGDDPEPGPTDEARSAPPKGRTTRQAAKGTTT